MTDTVRRLGRDLLTATPDGGLRREWLVANGLGGFATATVSGALTRRYHGLLIAALPAPVGRVVMLSRVSDHLALPDGERCPLSAPDFPARDIPASGSSVATGPHLAEFRLEAGLPVWRFETHSVVLERRIVMPYRQNTVHVTYHLVRAPAAVRLELRPMLAFRPLEAPVDQPLVERYRVTAAGRCIDVSAGEDAPSLRLMIDGAAFPLTLDGGEWRDIVYPVEAERGYVSCGRLWSIGAFSGSITEGQTVTLVASTEPWSHVTALPPAEVVRLETERRGRLIGLARPEVRHGAMAELVLAADAFLVVPVDRVADAMRAEAAGDETRTILAGYPWFTDWGRDAMISLEGLALVTGRHAEAGWILRTFARYIRDGLLPNMFPDGQDEGLYHTADATLWFFHALHRFVAATGDRRTLRQILPSLVDIVDRHRQGTRFGIHVDPLDGLLCQGQDGLQLTWMDAKVDDWVVTPRRGKAVEINALWYNALRLLAHWLEEEGDGAARRHHDMASQARASFNRRFWNGSAGFLYDVVDGPQGDDPRCRPNQILAVALDHPVLDRGRWPAVVRTVRDRLLTPVGLRSLAPDDADFRSRYDGDLRARDAAYHQGTVWAWLIGPMVDAWLKLHPGDRATARGMLEGFVRHLDEAGIGTVSEIFDAEAPFAPRGCVAQAWSVAEVLRSWVATAAIKERPAGESPWEGRRA